LDEEEARWVGEGGEAWADEDSEAVELRQALEEVYVPAPTHLARTRALAL
jgi:hypothetical protein